MIVGVDLGATHLRTAIAEMGSTVATHRRQTPSTGGAAVTSAVTTAVETVCTDAGITPTAIDAVGIGSIGPLDDTGVRNPPNLPGVDSIDLVQPLESLTDAPVELRNDAIAGVIAERHAGAPPNTVYLTLSTGIGAGACVDGHILTGDHGNAAEVGHFVVDPTSSYPCHCGGIGHWEAFCGGAAIPGYTRHVHATTNSDTTLPLAESTLDSATVLDAAGSDPLADHVIDRIVHYNTVGITDIIHAYDPTTLVVGGAVARNHPNKIVSPVQERLQEYLLGDLPTIQPTDLDNPVLTGALAIARDTVQSG